MSKYKLEDLKEIPLSQKFILEQKKEIMEKANSNQKLKFRKYAISSLAIATLFLIFFYKKNKQPNPIYTEDSIYFYQSMDMLEYMDILESLTKEELQWKK